MRPERTRPPLVRGTRPPEIPLSFAQRRLWFLNRLGGPGPNYNEPVVLRFTGAFDAAAMTAALGDVVERHESLRTIFVDGQGSPLQQILDLSRARPSLVAMDTSDTELSTQMAAVLRQPFDLSIEPPLRAYLFVLAPDRHVVLLVIHHIAIDGWSIQRILIGDLTKAYEARRLGADPRLPPLPVQYADYTLWQQQLLGSEDDPASVISRELAFWTRTLDGLPEQLSWPTDLPRPAVPTFRGAMTPIHLGARLHASLAALARTHRATVFMLLQAGIAALLTRLGAGTDIPIGTPVSGRTTTVVHDLVGFFANMIVVRTDTSGNPRFSDLLSRVRQCVLAACAHDELPFERLVDALNPSRSLARNPLFQVMLGFQTVVPRIEASPRERDVGRRRLRAGNHARFDLSFEFLEQRFADGAPRGIVGTLQYSTDLFHPSTAERIAQSLRRLLEAIILDPQQRLDDLDLVSATERRQLLQEWAAGPGADVAPPVAERVEQQAERTPQATAVIGEDDRLSFQALNERANRLAHFLVAQGIGAEDVVAVAVPRSAQLVVCLLGVLKAGAACLPLDPEHPSRHLASLLDQAAPRRILTTSEVVRALPPQRPLTVLDSPPVIAALTQQATSNPAIVAGSRRVLPDQAAYVVFTAGTTGAPKGVVLTHRGVANLMSALEAALPVEAGDRLLAMSSIGSDMAIFELFGPLVNGATTIVASSAELAYPSALARTLEQEEATVILSRPGALQALIEHVPQPIPRLRLAIARDAPPAPASLRSLHRLGRQVVHLYGTTETSACTTWATLDPEAVNVAPIGRPLANQHIYVLDHRLQPVPIGVPGDLYIGGLGVARGYVGSPGHTAACFVADPHGPPRARMCRTGDRARWRHDGQLELLGRQGDDVTIGRDAIDLAGVASALRACPGVCEAVAMRHPRAEEQTLVAYVSSVAGRRLDAEVLRQQLARTLPRAAVPCVIVPLEALPRTPNGSIDREALPPPTLRPTVRRAPQTAAEQTLCQLFADILGVSQVSLDDNFFELGGHSLLVMRLINRVRTALDLEIDVRTFFAAPTVAALAQRLQPHRSASVET